MIPEQHQRALSIFDDAVALQEDRRQDYLEHTCGSDVALRSLVERMLASDASARNPEDGNLGLAVCGDRRRAVDTDAIDLPAQFGRYRVLDVLGRGAAGVVYRAEQDNPRRVVALKVLHADSHVDEMCWRFENEIRVLARLRHPGIAQVYDAGTCESAGGVQPYIAMEIVDGVPLTAFADAQRLGMRERLELLKKVCHAVSHAHQRGVIHRDLKPANILVEDAAEGPRPRILDFGIARLTGADAKDVTQATVHGQLLGTLAYMSPEQLEGDPENVDVRSDVYALGVVGYELLCGEHPIDVKGLSVLGALDALRTREPHPLHEHAPKLRGDLTRIFSAALAREKEHRYASADALADDIDRYLTHRPILARDQSPLYVISKFVRRRRGLVAALSVVAALAIVGVVREQAARSQLREQYEQTRDVAGFLAGDLAASLDSIVGTADARRVMLERLREHIESLLPQNPDDPTLLTAYADVLTHLSDLEQSENHLDTALDFRMKALALRRQIADTEPDVPGRQAALSIIMVKLGDLQYRALDNREAGEIWYLQALQIDEQLVKQHPATRSFADSLGRSYARMGWVSRNRGDVDAGAEYLAKCLGCFEELARSDPSDCVALHGLWEAHEQLAQLALAQGERHRATEHRRESLRYSRQLVRRQPENRDYLAACATSLANVARDMVRADDLEAAAEVTGEARGIADKLCALDPLDAENRARQCMAILAECAIALERGDVDAARDLANRAVEVADRLVAENAKNPRNIRRLATAQHHAARAARLDGDEAAVRAHFTRELELLGQLTAAETASVADLVGHAKRLVRPMVRDLADADAAADLALRAIALSSGVNAEAWMVSGKCSAELGDTERAIECLTASLDLLPETERARREAIAQELKSMETADERD